jgi:uncharacterized membrane protein
MKPPPWLVVVLIGALIGMVFAGVSTYDFVQHLDRQVHSLHCSFILGSHAAGTSSGCQAAMMSSYSSILRTNVWGGIPISLGAMAVFAFIAFYTLDLVVTRRKYDRKATLFLVAACALPAVTSVIMLIISLTKLGTTCKLCVCIYTASTLCLVGAILGYRRAVRGESVGSAKSRGDSSELLEVPAGASNGLLGGMFGVGVAFVAIPIVLYLAMAPDNSKFIGTCDSLPKPDDTYGVMIHLAKGGPDAAPALEIFDPLCPSCKAFESRLAASGMADKLDRKAILFPLDSTCNWMVPEVTHPGACTISEAVLCAGDRAPDVIAWAFEVQDQVREQTKADPTAAARMVKQRFPELAACVGSPEAKAKINKSLRWAVANNIHVLTPQLFIDNTKLCDEDVDLGLEYALTIMLDRHAKGTLAPIAAAGTPAPAPADTKPTPPTDTKPAPPPETKPAPPPETKPAPPPETKPAPPPETKPAPPPETKPTPPPDETKPTPTEKPAPAPAETPPAGSPSGSAEGSAP